MSGTKESALGTENISSLMLRLSLPAILAQVINILYNIVDRIYIGHIQDASSLALTGLGVCSPVIMLVSAFSFFAGTGGAPLAAIELGKTEHDRNALKNAESILGNAFILLVFFSVVLGAAFFAFRKPILVAFGASKATLPYASEYLEIYLCGTVFVLLALGLNPFISCQGHARTAMVSTLIGVILNIALDPIFIFVLGMGVRGAAMATIISQGASAAWILIFLSSKKSAIRLSAKIIRFKFEAVKKISALGVSPFIMSATESAIFVVFNSGLQKFGGDDYVGAMTIMQSLMQLGFVPVQGFTDGTSPIISYNFGAKKIERVKKTIRMMTAISFSATIVFAVFLNALRAQAAAVFTDSAELISLVEKLLPIYFGAFWIFGIQMSAQRTFVSLGKAGVSVFIALLRKVILLIPLALILPHYFGVMGIFWAEPVASTLSALTSGIFLILVYRKIGRRQ